MGVDSPERSSCCTTGLSSGSDSLVDAVRLLALAGDLQSVSDIVKSAARTMAGADGTTFVLLDGFDKEISFYFDEDAISPLWKGKRFPADSCISGWAMRNKLQVVIPDILIDSRIPQDAYEPTFVKSLVMTPVRREDPIAAIGTYWSHQHTPSDEHLLLIQTLADVTAVALENIQVRQTLDVASEMIDEQATAFFKLNRFREDLVAHLTHDLRSSLIGQVDTANYLCGVCQDEHLKDILQVLRANSRQVLYTLNKIIELNQHIVPKQLEMRPVSLQSILNLSLREMSEAISESKLKLQLDLCHEVPQLRANPSWLERLFTNLMNNAISYSNGDGRILVTLTRDESDAIISIADEGVGISEADRANLFTTFWRGDRADQYSLGRGFGLYLCKQIVEAHNGTISFDSEVAVGTTFTVRLPLEQPQNS